MASRLVLLIVVHLFLSPVNVGALQGKALALDGVRDYVQIEDTPDLHLREVLTISAWFRVESLPVGAEGWQALFYKGIPPDRSSSNMCELGLWLNDAGALEFDATPAGADQSGGARKIRSETGLVRVGQWYHVAVSVNTTANSMSIYLNGDRVAEGLVGAATVRDWPGALRIGSSDDRDYFNGIIDEVQIWDRALDRRDILLNMNRPLLGSEEGLVSYYTFDELDEFGSLPDDTGKGHTGVLHGDAQLVSVQVLMPPAAGARVDSAALVGRGQEGGPGDTHGYIAGEAADLLVIALKHHDSGVRRRAALALGKVAARDFARVMRVALHSHDSVVRHHAAEVLSARDFGALATQLQPANALGTAPVVIDGGEVAVESEPLSTRPNSVDTRGYKGWEQRWSEPQTALFWTREPEGLMGRFNRVEGGYISWHFPRSYHPGAGLANYGELGYSSGRNEISYRAGAELFSFYHAPNTNDNLLTIGVELHDEVDTQDGWLIAREENSVDALLFRRDFRDYYRRRGWSAYSTHNFGGVLQVTGRYGLDEFESLATQVDEIFVGNRFARRTFRANPAIDDGRISSLSASVQLDTRDRRDGPQRGFFANALFERAGGFLGGDAEFKRYLGDIRRYQPIGRGTRLDLRLRLGTAKGPLPSQYAYDIGGLGSVRGYGFKEFSGDRMVLLNAEYWVDADAHWRGAVPINDMGIGVFFDMGSAWKARDKGDPFDRRSLAAAGQPQEIEWAKSLGLAVALGNVRIQVAKPLDAAEQEWQFTLRLGRTF
jgi:hypothetical protein